MDEQRETRSFAPEDSGEAAAQLEVAATCEAEKPPRGNALLGILGALLGALIGAVPWFLASTFANIFVGWLGFFVGVAACYGYRLCKGRRSTRFAKVTVIASSIFALFASEIASWMFTLCTDLEWQADAAQYGIPVAKLAWDSLMMPENWNIIGPNMVMSMFIGVIGVVCVERKVLAYTDPERLTQIEASYALSAEQAAQTNETSGAAQTRCFTVRERKWKRVMMRFSGGVFFCFCCVFLFAICDSVLTDQEDWTLFEVFYLLIFFFVLLALGVFVFCAARRKLVVEDGMLCYLPTFGKARIFGTSDIAGMVIGSNGRKLIGHDGKTLARYEDSMENSLLLLQHLRNSGVGWLKE